MKLSAIYLKSPQGYQIAKAKKTQIITPVKNLDYVGKTIYVVSEDKIYARIQLNQPYSVNHTLFKSSYDKHLISEEERKKIWPDEKQFWAYTFKLLKSYSPPVYCGRLQNPNLFVKEVEPKKINEVRLYNGESYHTFSLDEDEVLVRAKLDDLDKLDGEFLIEGDSSFKLMNLHNKIEKAWAMKDGKAVFG